MAEITGAVVLNKYSSGEQHNSFYEEQSGNHSSTADYGDKHTGEVLAYYIDASSGEFKASNTRLVGDRL